MNIEKQLREKWASLTVRCLCTMRESCEYCDGRNKDDKLLTAMEAYYRNIDLPDVSYDYYFQNSSYDFERLLGKDKIPDHLKSIAEYYKPRPLPQRESLEEHMLRTLGTL